MDSEKWWREQARQEPQPQPEAERRDCGPEKIGMSLGPEQDATAFRGSLSQALACALEAVWAAPTKQAALAVWGAVRSLVEARYADCSEAESHAASSPRLD